MGWESCVGSHRGVINEGWMTGLFSPVSSASVPSSQLVTWFGNNLHDSGRNSFPNKTENCKSFEFPMF